jgi:hypothetical protein
MLPVLGQGSGWRDYTRERHKWFKETSVEKLAEKIVKSVAMSEMEG